MNTKADAIRVLCFGDSNTWGHVPGTEDDPVRYAPDKRWTGIVQDILGTGYEIIEEGLNSRCISVSDPRPGKEGRSAMEYIHPCLASHAPLDIVVIMLGTNDMKLRFGLSVHDIGESMAKLVGMIGERLPTARIIVISPPYIEEGTKLTGTRDRFKGAHDKSVGLARVYSRVAEEVGVAFIDAGPIAEVGEDGVHLTEEGHLRLAEAVVEVIGRI